MSPPRSSSCRLDDLFVGPRATTVRGEPSGFEANEGVRAGLAPNGACVSVR